MTLDEIIWVDPDRLGGQLCFRGTRIPVWILLDYLEAGHGIGEFLRQYPDLSPEVVKAYLRLAHENFLAKAG